MYMSLGTSYESKTNDLGSFIPPICMKKKNERTNGVQKKGLKKHGQREEVGI